MKLTKELARRFAAAYNHEDMDECDRIARAVTGRPDARGGLRPEQRWDRDVVLNTRDAYDFLTEAVTQARDQAEEANESEAV